MKFILFCFLFTPIFTNGQNLNVVNYEADFIHESIIENFETPTQKKKQEKVIGIKVKIKIDTIFNKYSIMFTDEDNKEKIMVYKYVSNFFGVVEEFNNKTMRRFFMESQEISFLLLDYIELFKEVKIVCLTDIKDNQNLVYTIKNIRAITSK